MKRRAPHRIEEEGEWKTAENNRRTNATIEMVEKRNRIWLIHCCSIWHLECVVQFVKHNRIVFCGSNGIPGSGNGKKKYRRGFTNVSLNQKQQWFIHTIEYEWAVHVV